MSSRTEEGPRGCADLVPMAGDGDADMLERTAAAWLALSPAERQSHRHQAMLEATHGIHGWAP